MEFGFRAPCATKGVLHGARGSQLPSGGACASSSSCPVQAWVSSKCGKENPNKLLELYPTIWKLALPEEDVRKLVEAEARKGWKVVEMELQRVVQSCTLGEKLFSFAYVGMRRSWVLQSLDAALEKLAGHADAMTEQIVAESQCRLLCDLEKYLDDEGTKKKKPEKIMYRGLPLEIEVSSRHQHIELAYVAFVKGYAASHGFVPLFGPEADVFGKCDEKEVLMDAALYAKTKGSRDYASLVLSKGTFDTAAAMQADLYSHS